MILVDMIKRFWLFTVFLTVVSSSAWADGVSRLLRMSEASIVGRGSKKVFYSHPGLPVRRALISMRADEAAMGAVHVPEMVRNLQSSVIGRLQGYADRGIPVPRTFGVRFLENDHFVQGISINRGRVFGVEHSMDSFRTSLVPMVEIERYEGTLRDVMSGEIRLSRAHYDAVRGQIEMIVKRMERARYVGTDMGASNWYLNVHNRKIPRVVLGDPDIAAVGSEALGALEHFHKHDQLLHNLDQTKANFLIP
ncbi:MAG: hypothetical protein COV44_03645 [Deltaproteobacteria bacterium CG11_big_fil_rev_8_21_14_0_20_45_16]|nr:MAG: hypothetical protein COV44_03645 [Deltaproteobacteria bacterium CG11_big_fil_rev_8_21_14_0_20_45_16]